eukprot:CAMPEP_0182894402 /NCGR_PEP_ID=MMETSP0034_2-20130328/25054_1 /TAXON_ID=156128 /ORGANISM="Nephroselmis pyriformis, Strain CCMP717" /LENGTH=289 /DNA_ID=CAMNT_0025028181 /DNA_START=49 /DNA_END=914 /DNA_ORIENTATION=+
MPVAFDPAMRAAASARGHRIGRPVAASPSGGSGGLIGPRIHSSACLPSSRSIVARESTQLRGRITLTPRVLPLCSRRSTVIQASAAGAPPPPPAIRVAVICGGPSAERGISLNSARSVLDHLANESVQVSCYYIDQSLRAWAITNAQMYSNTPSDFDFKLSSTAELIPSLEDFAARLRATSDIAFPALHGKYGEDGGIQALLEAAGVPFVGTGASEAENAFDKYTSSRALAERGFVALASTVLVDPTEDEAVPHLESWFSEIGLDSAAGRVVVKPARGGSSLGVSVALG